MGADHKFATLLERVRRGDEDACRTLVETYANEIRRVVRVRLREPLLRSTVDTTDIFQSVLLDFFARVRLGQYEFDSPRDLVNLLLTMARHKLLNHGRHARVRRLMPQSVSADLPSPLDAVADPGESPSQIALGAELIDRAMTLLSPEERQIAAYRRDGQDWKEIAVRLGEGAEALRKRLARAIDRVLTALDLQRDES